MSSLTISWVKPIICPRNLNGLSNYTAPLATWAKLWKSQWTSQLKNKSLATTNTRTKSWWTPTKTSVSRTCASPTTCPKGCCTSTRISWPRGWSRWETISEPLVYSTACALTSRCSRITGRISWRLRSVSALKAASSNKRTNGPAFWFDLTTKTRFLPSSKLESSRLPDARWSKKTSLNPSHLVHSADSRCQRPNSTVLPVRDNCHSAWPVVSIWSWLTGVNVLVAACPVIIQRCRGFCRLNPLAPCAIKMLTLWLSP